MGKFSIKTESNISLDSLEDEAECLGNHSVVSSQRENILNIDSSGLLSTVSPKIESLEDRNIEFKNVREVQSDSCRSCQSYSNQFSFISGNSLSARLEGIHRPKNKSVSYSRLVRPRNRSISYLEQFRKKISESSSSSCVYNELQTSKKKELSVNSVCSLLQLTNEYEDDKSEGPVINERQRNNPTKEHLNEDKDSKELKPKLLPKLGIKEKPAVLSKVLSIQTKEKEIYNVQSQILTNQENNLLKRREDYSNRVKLRNRLKMKFEKEKLNLSKYSLMTQRTNADDECSVHHPTNGSSKKIIKTQEIPFISSTSTLPDRNLPENNNSTKKTVQRQDNIKKKLKEVKKPKDSIELISMQQRHENEKRLIDSVRNLILKT